MIWTRNNQRIPRITIIVSGAIIFLLGLLIGLVFRAETAYAQEATSTSPATYSAKVNITNVIPTMSVITVPVITTPAPSASAPVTTAAPAAVPVVITVTQTPTVSVVTTTGTCPAVTSYLKAGWANNSAEMMKLQDFLRNQGGTQVAPTGVFDDETVSAVSAFQTKYANEVLAPWGISTPTGFVYVTTKNKINEIACGTDIPLTQEELAIISEARANGTALAVATNGIEAMENESSAPVSEGITTTVKAPVATEANDANDEVSGVDATEEEEGSLAVIKDNATSTGALATWRNRMATALFAVPEDAQDLYKAGANIILILAVLAIAWLILKEYVFYRKGLPGNDKVNRTRLIFFAAGALIASIVMAFSPTPAATLPLFALFVILVVMIFTQGVGMAPLAMQSNDKKGGNGNMQRNNMVPMKTENRAPLSQKQGDNTQQKGK